jgi:hypothetical protein
MRGFTMKYFNVLLKILENVISGKKRKMSDDDAHIKSVLC